MIEVTVILAAIIYVVWGIVHHWHHGDLHLKVVLEYLGLAVLGVTVILSVIKNL